MTHRPTASGGGDTDIAAVGALVADPGRCRILLLSGPAVGDLIETLQRLAPVAPVRSLRQGSRAGPARGAYLL
jgi:hypothetical protein